MMSQGDIGRIVLPWEPSVVVPVVLLCAVAAYERGRQVVMPSAPQAICFWAGLISVYAVSFTGFDYYAEHAFFMHRLQHAVLHHLAPVLIVISRPGAALSAGLPLGWADRLRQFGRWRPARFLLAFLNHPAVAVLLFCGLIFLWLIPAVHFIAMLDVRFYKLMNWGMAVNGLMFWGLVLNNYALRPGDLPASVRIMMMVAIVPPQILIGLVLLMSPQDLYPIYTMCGRVFEISPLADQQLGGAILWVSGAMMSVVGCVVVMVRAAASRAMTGPLAR
jgi:putative membrane protein